MKRKSCTPVAKKRIAGDEQNISKDSLESSPVKPMKAKSKLLAMLDTDFVFSPIVTKTQGTTEETFLENTNIDADFMQTNIASFSDMSFATRRCSTAFKQLDKKPNLELSPRVKVSPRELFNNSRERRLSSDTYVVSASNSLEGASGESILATSASPGPSRLSRVAEVTEHVEEWSMNFQECNTHQRVQLTSLADAQISGVNFHTSSTEPDLQAEILISNEQKHEDKDLQVQTEQRDQTEDVHGGKTFEISPPHRQAISHPHQVSHNAQEMFEISPPHGQATQFCTEEVEIHETFEILPLQTESNAEEVEHVHKTFEISPPQTQSTKSHKETHMEVKVHQNVHETFEISPPNKQQPLQKLPANQARNKNSRTTFNISPPKKTAEKTKTCSSTTFTQVNVSSTSFLQFSPPKPFRLPKVDWSNEASTSRVDGKNATYVTTKGKSPVEKKKIVLMW